MPKGKQLTPKMLAYLGKNIWDQKGVRTKGGKISWAKAKGANKKYIKSADRKRYLSGKKRIGKIDSRMTKKGKPRKRLGGGFGR